MMMIYNVDVDTIAQYTKAADWFRGTCSCIAQMCPGLGWCMAAGVSGDITEDLTNNSLNVQPFPLCWHIKKYYMMQ